MMARCCSAEDLQPQQRQHLQTSVVPTSLFETTEVIVLPSAETVDLVMLTFPLLLSVSSMMFVAKRFNSSAKRLRSTGIITPNGQGLGESSPDGAGLSN
jgi:hypothetical protein